MAIDSDKLAEAVTEAIHRMGGFIDDEASMKLDELCCHIAEDARSKESKALRKPTDPRDANPAVPEWTPKPKRKGK